MDQAISGLTDEDLKLWTLIGEELIKCVGSEAGNELARIFEYQIGLLGEDTAIKMLANHAVECAVAYINRQVGRHLQQLTALF